MDAVAKTKGKTAVVHPLVLLSVQDHAERVSGNTSQRVVGMLLGEERGSRVIITNSFAVPFEEDDKDNRTWYLDHNYIEAMRAMFKKTNAREKLVGWYHTGPNLRSNDLAINEVMKQHVARPTLCVIDVRATRLGTDSEIPIETYTVVDEIRDDGTATDRTFIHMASIIEAEEAEEIGVEHLLREVSSASSGGSLSQKLTQQVNSLAGLRQRLENVIAYLSQVLDGKLPINHQLVYILQDIFNLLPNIDKIEDPSTVPDSSTRPFTLATNDEMLVMYMSALVRTVISLHDLVQNKKAAMQAEADQERALERPADKPKPAAATE